VTERRLDPELLLLASARLSRWASRSSELGLPVAAARLLSLVEELQPVGVSALAQADQTSQPTMSTHVQRLERAGLVSRGADSGDARVRLVRLTDEGAAKLADVRRRRAAVLTPYLEQMSEPDRRRLAAAQATLVELLDRVERAPTTRKTA